MKAARWSQGAGPASAPPPTGVAPAPAGQHEQLHGNRIYELQYEVFKGIVQQTNIRIWVTCRQIRPRTKN